MLVWLRSTTVNVQQYVRHAWFVILLDVVLRQVKWGEGWCRVVS